MSETTRLIDQLACALKTQALHVQQAVAPGHPGNAIAADLAREAASVSDHARRLIELAPGAAAGEHARPAPLAPLSHLTPAPAARSSNGGFGEGAPVEDSARALALELKMDGARRDDVEHFLRDSFGITDASAVVDQVYAQSPR